MNKFSVYYKYIPVMLKKGFQLFQNRHWQILTLPSRQVALQSQNKGNDNKDLWIGSPFTPIEPLNGVTLPELIWSRLPLIRNDKIAFEGGITKRRYTYKEMYRYSRSFGASLIRAGFKRGDILSVILPNTPEYPIVVLGGLEAGLVITPVNSLAMPYEIECHLKRSETIVAVTTPSILETVRLISSTLKHIIVVGEPQEGCHSFFEMIKTDVTGIEFVKGSQINTKDEVLKISFSSGTTGVPKGVLLTHYSMIANLLQINHKDVRSWGSIEDGDQERFLAVLPFFHSYSFMATLTTALYQGVHCYCLPKLENYSFLDALRQHKPTFLHLAASLSSYLLKSSELGRADLGAVRGVTSGASAMRREDIDKFLDKAGHPILFQEGYGMTEMSPVCLILGPHTKNQKLGSVGEPLPLTVAKVVDNITGKTVGPNVTGELWLKGPQMMKGYRNNDEETRKTIDPEGWLHTGDMVYYDNDKCFYIVERLKDLIKSKGFQVSPFEIESLLREIEGVEEAVVIGIPDERSQEVPRAYIIKSNPNLTEQDVHNYINQRLIPYKRLKGGVEFVKSIPKNFTGKTLKNKLKEEYLQNVKMSGK